MREAHRSVLDQEERVHLLFNTGCVIGINTSSSDSELSQEKCFTYKQVFIPHKAETSTFNMYLSHRFNQTA